jgi:hypothetical protein
MVCDGVSVVEMFAVARHFAETIPARSEIAPKNQFSDIA